MTIACPREGGGGSGEQIGESRQPVKHAWRERIVRGADKMRGLHLIRRIGTLNRSNLVALRQIESVCLAVLACRSPTEHIDRYDEIRPSLGPNRD